MFKNTIKFYFSENKYILFAVAKNKYIKYIRSGENYFTIKHFVILLQIPHIYGTIILMEKYLAMHLESVMLLFGTNQARA